MRDRVLIIYFILKNLKINIHLYIPLHQTYNSAAPVSHITQFQPATFKVSKFLGDNGFLLNEFDDENVAKKFMKDTTEKLNVDKRRIIFFPDNLDFIQNFVLYGYSY